MGSLPLSMSPFWAVHISDGVLTNSWLAGGFGLAGLLVLAAAYRVRDEEVPRIALLSSAFFVATLLHVRLGPSSVHLLLNGLVGVVLGRRAPLAIFIGLGLQAALLGHGGFTTLGVNTCVLALPAVLAGWLFALSQRISAIPLFEILKRSSARAIWNWVVGCAIGMFAVLLTLILNALVLLWGGAEDWHQIVVLVFVAHLPIVVIEGIVLGFTVSFLARVKPEMLGRPAGWFAVPDGADERWPGPASVGENNAVQRPAIDTVSSPHPKPDAVHPSTPHSPALLLALVFTLLSAGPVWAHRLDADFKVLPDRRVQIEGWFDLTDKPPKGAQVQVFRTGQRLLTEGQLDQDGTFVFAFTEAETLEVVINAGAGHRASVSISRERLERALAGSGESQPSAERLPTDSFSSPSSRRAEWGDRLKDGLLGVGFLLALAAFILSWRNSRTLHSLQRSGHRDSNSSR